ncbi:hypothetical protein C482_19606 [Natrialba chahannaoensis JCM 10990]|uniref:D-aminoacyl-tRNA deacylase n=1 Tax=Natrialba chahannaoensis JCM 10990 TaxID=1227492 RepID=M0A3N5_9EURY|nr:D-aminoacyl-tRNA deacylase [Natrialba chahannaoensis]ELY93209.1 hypothetical protein C482_19606 [Natrialba chahannaoensis JCM 10990]
MTETDVAIVESRADRASVHICDQLRELADWTEHRDEVRPDADGGGTYYTLADLDGVELRSFETLHIELESPANAFDCDPDLLVFASRHSGDTGALLTGHFTGNFGPAEYGGDDDAVAEACPNALAELLAAFDKFAPDGYEVGMECTHHGPTDVGCPSLFAELGSDDEQWDDPEGARAVARGILEIARDSVAPHRDRQLVGFGGNHYAPRFERVVRETPWAVGHIAADWALESMGHPTAHRAVIDAAFEASQADVALLDGEWPVLESTLDEAGHRVVSETWLREVGDRQFDLIDAVESTLGTVEEGVRFGEHREPSFTLVDLPGDLIDTAEGIDPERVRAIIEAHTVAFTTENGGSRVGTQFALPEGVGRLELVEELAEVLESAYETVTVEADAVVAEKTAFDPALAQKSGVPEGPKFGALASGESVTVDGEEITPGRVERQQIDRFEI